MQASDNRAVAETKCNERSSRSHSVFRLKIDGLNTHTQESCTGKIHNVRDMGDVVLNSIRGSFNFFSHKTFISFKVLYHCGMDSPKYCKIPI